MAFSCVSVKFLIITINVGFRERGKTGMKDMESLRVSGQKNKGGEYMQ